MTHRHKWSPGNEDNPRPHCVLCGDDGEVDGGEVVERRVRWPFMRPTLALCFAGKEER